MQDILPILVYRRTPDATGPRYLAVFWGKPRGEIIPYAPIAETVEGLPTAPGPAPLVYQCEHPPFPKYRYMSLARSPHFLIFSGESAEEAERALSDWWANVQAREAVPTAATEAGEDHGQGEGETAAKALSRTSNGVPSNDNEIWERIAEAIESRRYASQQEVAEAVGTVQTKVSQLMIKAEKTGVMPRETVRSIFKEVRAARQAKS